MCLWGVPPSKLHSLKAICRPPKCCMTICARCLVCSNKPRVHVILSSIAIGGPEARERPGKSIPSASADPFPWRIWRRPRATVRGPEWGPAPSLPLPRASGACSAPKPGSPAPGTRREEAGSPGHRFQTPRARSWAGNVAPRLVPPRPDVPGGARTHAGAGAHGAGARRAGPARRRERARLREAAAAAAAEAARAAGVRL